MAAPDSSPLRRLVALPSAMGDTSTGAFPAAALGALLRMSRIAGAALDEARHRFGVARRSTEAAEGASRSARDQERLYTNERRRVDPHHVRTLHFGIGTVMTVFLCLLGAAAVTVLVWNLGWLWRITVPLIVAALAGGVAWQAVVRRRQELGLRPFVFVATTAVALLTALHAFTTTGSVAVAWLSGLGLAVLVVGAVTAATWVLEHLESKVVASLRRRWERAEKARGAAERRAARDQEAAELAEEAWVGLVEQEARLAVTEGETRPESWVSQVVEHARALARQV